MAEVEETLFETCHRGPPAGGEGGRRADTSKGKLLLIGPLGQKPKRSRKGATGRTSPVWRRVGRSIVSPRRMQAWHAQELRTKRTTPTIERPKREIAQHRTKKPKRPRRMMVMRSGAMSLEQRIDYMAAVDGKLPWPVYWAKWGPSL